MLNCINDAIIQVGYMRDVIKCVCPHDPSVDLGDYVISLLRRVKNEIATLKAAEEEMG